MPAERAYAIVIEASTPLQREQVQAMIKDKAESWWHGIADLWLVTGKSAKEWKDMVRVFFPEGSGSVLVLKIDTSSSETWSYRSALFSKSQEDWILENL